MEWKKRDNQPETMNVAPKPHIKNKKWRKYLVFLCIVLVILGFVAFTLHRYVTYQNMVELARLQTDLDQRIKKCKQAIAFHPNRTEAYRLMLQSMLTDGNFTDEEERIYLSSIKQPVELERAKGFSDLAYETGKAYLYYYTYGCTSEESKDMIHPENLIVRMQSCHTWFDKAAMYSKEKSYYKETIALRDISKFYIENTKRIAEGTDTEKIYLKCWDDIKNLTYITPKETKVEAFRIYEIVLDTLLTYRSSLFNSGVAAEDIQLLVSDIEKDINEVKAETKREKSWKKWLLEKQNQLYEKLS